MWHSPNFLNLESRVQCVITVEPLQLTYVTPSEMCVTSIMIYFVARVKLMNVLSSTLNRSFRYHSLIIGILPSEIIVSRCLFRYTAYCYAFFLLCTVYVSVLFLNSIVRKN